MIGVYMINKHHQIKLVHSVTIEGKNNKLLFDLFCEDDVSSESLLNLCKHVEFDFYSIERIQNFYFLIDEFMISFFALNEQSSDFISMDL